MKEYLMNISKELKNFSLSLNKTSILINKPWALLDEDGEIQKLIFKKNKDLILSKNGKVQIGKWDYFPEAGSLLIDRKTDTILCNEAFIDKGVMILKMDGTQTKYFTLANENMVPDLNALNYLHKLRNKNLNIKEYKLYDGRTLEVHMSPSYIKPSEGDKIKIDDVQKVNGLLKLAKSERFVLIDHNIFNHFYTEKKYKTLGDDEISIVQKWEAFVSVNDFVFLDGEIPSQDEFYLSKSKRLILTNGRIDKIQKKYFNIFWL